MARTRPTTAQALLAAQVKFIVDELSGAGLKTLIEDEIDAALADAGRLQLGEVVTREMIKRTAHAYAIDIELGPGVPELVGDIARALYAHEAHNNTRVGDLIDDALFAELLDQGLELKSLREKLIREVVTSPLYTDFASDLLYRGITGYLAQNALTRNIPGAGSIMKLGRAALSKTTPKFEASLEDGLRKYIGKTVQASTGRSAEFLAERAGAEMLREIGLDIWQKLKHQQIGALREDIGSRDVEEIFVNGYEFWRSLRKSDYYRVLIDAGIDSFFDKYERATLAALLEDLGVTRGMIIAEGLRYAPPALKLLKKKKLLEPLLRRRLQGFYGSKAVADILAAGRT